MQGLISYLGSLGSIADILIQEPSIEEVIKVLYEKKQG
jgi:hypothetical protein